MNIVQKNFLIEAREYLKRINDAFTENKILEIESLAKDLRTIWNEKRQVFICGNGGSAANAIHIANDLLYGVGISESGNNNREAIRVEALSANTAIITCLANDTGYENIYSKQLEVKANSGDLLLVLSGSGNSKNIVNALRKSRIIGMKSYAIVAYDAGKCMKEAENVIHFPINDMQVAEDLQLVVGHLCMQWLRQNTP